MSESLSFLALSFVSLSLSLVLLVLVVLFVMFDPHELSINHLMECFNLKQTNRAHWPELWFCVLQGINNGAKVLKNGNTWNVKS